MHLRRVKKNLAEGFNICTFRTTFLTVGFLAEHPCNHQCNRWSDAWKLSKWLLGPIRWLPNRQPLGTLSIFLSIERNRSDEKYRFWLIR